MDDVFQALSDPTRRAMLRDLASGARAVGDLAAPHPMSLAAASRHIKVLEAAGLLRREVTWRTHICHLEPAPLARAYQELGFFEQFWTERLNVLEQLLRDDDARRAQGEDYANPARNGEQE